MPSLTYRNSVVEIRLGDEVIVKRIFMPAIAGTVCYVPGQCEPHPQFEIDGLSYWAVELRNGTVVSWPYAPGELHATKRVLFRKRGDAEAAAIHPLETLA
jgi:hypothetical protein